MSTSTYTHVLHTITTLTVCSLQTFLVFNKEDSSQLVSNSESTVVFYSWVKYPPYTHAYHTCCTPSLLIHLQHGSELKASSTPVSDKVRPLISGQIPRGSLHLSLLVCRTLTSLWVSCHNQSSYLVPPEH